MRRLLEWKPLVWLGSISYSLYLIHGAVYMIMALFLSRTEISRDARQLIYIACGPALAVAVASVFFQLCEKPFLSGIKIRREGRETVVEKAATVPDQAAP